MSGFRPTRASPPSKPIYFAESVAQSALSGDVSHSSAVSIPELQGLLPGDVKLLDAVIERAGPTATTFLTVFKAYNDVLQEQGLDPHEVVYYGKLLKLGTLKGKNWGDKWSMIKRQYGYSAHPVRPGASPKNHGHPKKQTPQAMPSTVKPHLTRSRDDDSFTLHSHQDETEIAQSETYTEVDIPQYHLTPRLIPHRPQSPSRSSVTDDSVDLDVGNPSHYPILAPPQLRSVPPHRQQHIHTWGSEVSEVTEHNAGAPSTTPPSYRAALRDPPIHERQTPDMLSRQRSKVVERQSPALVTKPSAATRQAISQTLSQARERRGSVVKEDDAWNKIKMLRDEEDADRFREDRLLERCWEVWKQGFRWIITTNEQIGQARDNLVVRISLQRWRNHAASRRELDQRVSTLANNRRLKAAFTKWGMKMKEKRQAEWRHGMRIKMKTIRERREGKVKKDAWAKWRQSYRSHLSEQHHSERLVLGFYRRWKERFSEMDHMDAIANEISQAMEMRAAERCWHHWKRAMEMRNAERIVLERMGLRIMGEVMDVWKKNAQDNRIANAHHDFTLLKSTIRSWKAAQDRIRVLENRATKHIARQDDLLLRAVSRVWKARERGTLLERVKAVRLIKDTWAVWKRHIHEQKERESLAVAFSLRSNSYVASAALRTWRQVRATHQNAESFAVQYHSAQFRYKILLIWRIRLREKLKMIKRARMADKFFTVRRAWRRWQDQLDEKRRKKTLRELEINRLCKTFHLWVQRTERERHRRLSEQRIQSQISNRIVQAALTRWTNRVIEVKLRELEVAQRYQNTVLSFAFKKWKGVCIRHVEELSLMESYQYVKREENIRRMFHRWLAAARASRYRRVTLQRKEDEIKLAAITVAWNKWRDRFSDEKLRPIEYNVVIQGQKNLLFRAFGIWHSKTNSLPAIRFHASHTKSKFWELWRGAMPRALQAKEAREVDRKAMLSKFLDRWMQTYKTKIALKAVARARYLRLPTAAPRQAITAPRSTLNLTTHTAFPRRPVRAGIADADEVEAGPSKPPMQFRPFGAGIASLVSKPRSETSAPRSKFPTPRAREPSPARSQVSFGAVRQKREASPTRSHPRPPSSAGGGEGRSRLWLEFQEVQRKSRPPSEHSRSHEPP